MNSEEALWTSVLVKAIEDGCKKPTERRFFDEKSKWFRFVCESADFQVERVAGAARQLFNRVDAGEGLPSSFKEAAKWLKSSTRRIR